MSAGSDYIFDILALRKAMKALQPDPIGDLWAHPATVEALRERAALTNIPIHASPYIPECIETGYPDWRERLQRNLGRPSTGEWEPLTHWTPAIFLINTEALPRNTSVFEESKFEPARFTGHSHPLLAHTNPRIYLYHISGA